MSSNNFNTYPPQSEMAASNDPTSFGTVGDVTSHAGHPTSTKSTGSFPSERAGYPNANMRGDNLQRSSGAPDPAYSGNATNAGAAETFRSAVGEESGRYGGHEGITDESMFGSPRTKAFKPADERTGAGIMQKAENMMEATKEMLGMKTNKD